MPIQPSKQRNHNFYNHFSLDLFLKSLLFPLNYPHLIFEQCIITFSTVLTKSLVEDRKTRPFSNILRKLEDVEKIFLNEKFDHGRNFLFFLFFHSSNYPRVTTFLKRIVRSWNFSRNEKRSSQVKASSSSSFQLHKSGGQTNFARSFGTLTSRCVRSRLKSISVCATCARPKIIIAACRI